MLSGESETHRVFSTGTGYARAIRFTNMAPVNLGGLKATVSSTFDSVTVLRYHNQFHNVADSSILRNMELTVRNGSGATIVRERAAAPVIPVEAGIFPFAGASPGRGRPRPSLG